MLPALRLLGVLQLFEDVQGSCSNGRIVYERIPGYRLDGFEERVIHDVTDPITLLKTCADLCRTNASSEVGITSCGFFNFQYGESLGRSPTGSDRWKQSSCQLPFSVSGDQKSSLKKDPAFDTYNEICLRAPDILDLRCPSKIAPFIRKTGYKFNHPDAFTVQVASREECQEKCLMETSFTCRSASFDTVLLMCHLSRYTMRTDPSLLIVDEDFDYLENECLTGLQRCQGEHVFVVEKNKELLGSKDLASFNEETAIECATRCKDPEGVLPFLCRGFHYNDALNLCILTEEPLNSQAGADLISSTNLSYHEEVCVQTGDETEWQSLQEKSSRLVQPDMESRQERIFQGLRGTEALEAFQRYRNYVMDADYYVTYRAYEVGRCLDECLRDRDSCMSVIYNPITLECRLSRFSQDDRRLVYDPQFDYYENLHLEELDEGILDDLGDLKLRHDTVQLTQFDPDVINQDIRSRIPIVAHGKGRGYYENYGGAFKPVVRRPPAPAPAPKPTSSKSFHSTRGYRPSRTRGGSRQSRCASSDQDTFRQVRSRTRLRSQYINKRATVSSLYECEQECLRERSFVCKSFNFISGFSTSITENCELSEKDSRVLDITNPAYFDQSELHDYYQRDFRSLDCIDVSQSCNEEGMEFTLRTPDSFRGRIYTYKHYDSPQCFVRGTGDKVHVLRIPGVGGYPNCGTEKYGDTITNIVVVQFSELIQTRADIRYNLTCTVKGPGAAVVTSGFIGAGESVQTSRDVLYNLTCTIQAPGETVVTSGYLGAGRSGQPTPIEYLPAEHTLDSRVRLVITYQGRPTSTIAVGDPLEFKLETQEGANLLRDIFATNVVAKDPYTSRTVELIDSRGCPIDPYVFPALGLSRSGDGLTTNFNAFKIPESNFLVFEATVRPCRHGCQPANCDGPQGRSESFGRRKKRSESLKDNRSDLEENFNVREMFRVYETRSEIVEEEIVGDSDPLLSRKSYVSRKADREDPSELTSTENGQDICLARSTYFTMVSVIFVLVFVSVIVAIVAGVCYKKVKHYEGKGQMVDLTHPLPTALPTISQASSSSSFPKLPLSFTSVKKAATSSKSSDRNCSRAGNFHSKRYPKSSEIKQPTFSYLQPEINPMGDHFFNSRNGSDDGSGFEDEARDQVSELRQRRQTFEDPSEPIFTDPTLFERNSKNSSDMEENARL